MGRWAGCPSSIARMSAGNDIMICEMFVGVGSSENDDKWTGMFLPCLLTTTTICDTLATSP